MTAHRAADHRQQPAHAEVVYQPSLHFDRVGNGYGGKVRRIRMAGERVDAVGAGSAAASAQDVGADDEIAVGIDEPARAHDDIPPSGRIRVVVPGHVRVAADGVADQDGVVARLVQIPLSLVSNGDRRQFAAEFQFERSVEGNLLGMQQRRCGTDRVAAVEIALPHLRLMSQRLRATSIHWLVYPCEAASA